MLVSFIQQNENIARFGMDVPEPLHPDSFSKHATAARNNHNTNKFHKLHISGLNTFAAGYLNTQR
jgi:hypothetical protein